MDAYRMIQRRAAELGTRLKIGCHTFRATGITAYLEGGGTLENAQANGGARKPAHDETLRPHRRRNHARRSGADHDLSAVDLLFGVFFSRRSPPAEPVSLFRRVVRAGGGTLYKMIHFVECLKTRPAIHAGFRGVRQAELSTKR